MKNSLAKVYAKKRPGSAGLLAVALVACVLTSVVGVGVTSLLGGTLGARRRRVEYYEFHQGLVDIANQMRVADFAALPADGEEFYKRDRGKVHIYVRSTATDDEEPRKKLVVDGRRASNGTSFEQLHLTRTKKGVGGGIPVGAIMAWTKESQPPDGGVWLKCDGRHSVIAYPALQKLLGRNLTPDLSGKYLRGYGRSDLDKTTKKYRYESGKLMKEQSWQEQEIKAEPDDNVSSGFNILMPSFVAANSMPSDNKLPIWDNVWLNGMQLLPNGAFSYRRSTYDDTPAAFSTMDIDNQSYRDKEYKDGWWSDSNLMHTAFKENKSKNLYIHMALEHVLNTQTMDSEHTCGAAVGFMPQSLMVDFYIKAE